MAIVDKKELAEMLCDDGPAFDAMQDLLMALAEGKAIHELHAIHRLESLAKARYRELSGESADDEPLAQREYNDYVASVHHAAAA